MGGGDESEGKGGVCEDVGVEGESGTRVYEGGRLLDVDATLLFFPGEAGRIATWSCLSPPYFV